MLSLAQWDYPFYWQSGCQSTTGWYVPGRWATSVRPQPDGCLIKQGPYCFQAKIFPVLICGPVWRAHEHPVQSANLETCCCCLDVIFVPCSWLSAVAHKIMSNNRASTHTHSKWCHGTTIRAIVFGRKIWAFVVWDEAGNLSPWCCLFKYH